MKKPKRPKYSGPARVKMHWPPQQEETGNKALKDGEPLPKRLKRFANDKAMRTEWWSACCECGFRHLFTFEVAKAPTTDGDAFYLFIRAYGDDKTRPRKVKRAKR